MAGGESNVDQQRFEKGAGLRADVGPTGEPVRASRSALRLRMDAVITSLPSPAALAKAVKNTGWSAAWKAASSAFTAGVTVLRILSAR